MTDTKQQPRIGIAADLFGRVAFVTGGASGIGLALAEAFVGEGMKVAIADVDPAALAEAGRRLGVQVFTLDVRDRTAWAEAARRTAEALGPVYILCNNAGVTTYDPLTDMPAANWDWVVGVNLTGVFNGVQAFVPQMIAAGAGGHVLNTASTAGLYGMRGYSIGAYAATKAGVIAFSRALKAELAPHGIGVSALCPGVVATRIGTTAASLRPAPAVRERPAVLANQKPGSAADPARIAQRVLLGLRRNEMHIITHPSIRAMVERQHEELMGDFREAADPEAEAIAAAEAKG